MASCPKCGKRPIRRKLDVRRCGHCGVLPDPAKALGASVTDPGRTT